MNKEPVMNNAQRFLVSAAVAIAALPLAVRGGELGVTSLAEAKAMYQHDVEACNSHAVPEDRRTCLLEARRAYEQGRREALQKQRRGRRGDGGS
jgi:hypothetical protein